MFEELLVALDQALRAAGIAYMVIGGQAVLRYGEPRMTKDIDLTLRLGPDELPRVRAALAPLGLDDLVDDPKSFVERTMVLPLRHLASGIRVDLVFSFSPYEYEAIDAAVTLPAGTGSARFARPEDLIIHKVFAGRPRDLEDVRHILNNQLVLNRDYIKARLTELSEVALVDLVQRFAECDRHH
ncbi:MAG: nucleotidyl transferase AbiEii/AbiGii toxin family protein [Acidobacteria bacterium]|nr:nucleotidyl transferase AbiEii/AbiGii toxin family protein [Acidobacteriota bacterium]